jgi:isopenicillin N synthase-like dioxygenase
MNIITQSAASQAARNVPRRKLPVIDVGEVVAGDPDAPAKLANQFHDLPEDVKQAHPLNIDHRGYMGIRSDYLEEGEIEDNRKSSITQAILTATEYPPDHPQVIAGTQFYGPNQWLPEDVVPGFRETTLAYMESVTELGKK